MDDMRSWSGFERVVGRQRPRRLSWRALVLAVLATGAQPVAAMTPPTEKTATLRLGATPWTPFTNEPGKARFAIDLVQAALTRVGVSAETTIVAEGTLTPALLEGRFDGSPALWRDAERENTLLYSKPYLENRLVLVGRRGSDVSATALVALAGKRVALVHGYAYGDAIEVPNGPAYVAASSVEESLEKVLAGQADYVLMDDLVVEYLLTNHPDQAEKRLAIGTTPLVLRTLHFAVRRDLPGARSIIDRFDAELVRMIADHSYHRLLQVGWIQADVDGDGRIEWVPAGEQAGRTPPAHSYKLTTLNASAPKPESEKRFYIGSQVYEDWANVPDRYKVMDTKRTPWGSQVAPIFSFEW